MQSQITTHKDGRARGKIKKLLDSGFRRSDSERMSRLSQLVSLGEHEGIAPTHPARLLCLLCFLWLNSRLLSRIFGRARGHRPYPPCSPLNWLSPSCIPFVPFVPFVAKLPSFLSHLPSRIFGRARRHRPYPPCSPLNWLSPSCIPFVPFVAKLPSALSHLLSCIFGRAREHRPSPFVSFVPFVAKLPSFLSPLASSLSPLTSSLILILTLSSVCTAAIGGGQVNVGKVLIPMDVTQTDHLKAYGIAFWALQEGHPVEWLLNYRGGSFLMDFHETIVREARIRAVSFQAISAAQATRIYADIESANMNRMHLEKAPRIAVYTPPHKQPWDDAVTLALTYAEIPYTTLWDEEVLSGQLEDYDWLHLHHEDFTGQYGKFYRSHGRQLWYRRQQAEFEALARKLGFAKVSQLKGAVARAIHNYMTQGGFLFAMCSATDTFDIALAARGVDIVDSVYDGDPADPMAQQKLDFSRTVAFENFNLVLDPMEYEHADIDLSPTEMSQIKDADLHAFSLFEFSAKYDPVPTMLTQNHTPIVPGFLGQTTAFRKDRIKKSVTIMGDIPGTNHVKYIHGNIGRGTFTFYAGHDPEDYQHFVNDPPTQLALHKNSPGYRLILNNILFPAAKKEKQKT